MQSAPGNDEGRSNVVPTKMRVSFLAAIGLTLLLLVPARAATREESKGPAPARGAPPSSPAASAAPLDADAKACPEGTLPDGPICVHIATSDGDGALLVPTKNAHREPRGRWTEYEQIARLPERPAEYGKYRYPIPTGDHPVVSGYDLDLPDRDQRRGRRLSHTGHGGVDLPSPRGTPVKLVALEHQQGPAQVLYAGPLFGQTVVTHHTVREAGVVRDYVVLHGHLDSIAQTATPGAELEDGALVGAVGDSGSPGIVHLHLEVRRVREDQDLRKVPAGAALIAESVSVVCDPRNVLPLR
jgi:hypothetical protein